MFAHHVPPLEKWSASATPVATRVPGWAMVPLRGLRMVAELLLVAAVVMIVGHLLGDWLGVTNPADPRTPGGPTPTDIEAFTAIGAVIVGLGLTGWRFEHGSLVIFAGALVFAVTMPELRLMAALFAMLGAINFGGWLVGLARAHHPAHAEHDAPAPGRRRDQLGHGRPHHIVGMF